MRKIMKWIKLWTHGRKTSLSLLIMVMKRADSINLERKEETTGCLIHIEGRIKFIQYVTFR